MLPRQQTLSGGEEVGPEGEDVALKVFSMFFIFILARKRSWADINR